MTDTKVRGVGELREIKAEISLLTRSDGSVIFAQGRTVVIASMNGPVEVKLQDLSVEKAFVEVYFRPKTGLPSINDRFIENFITNSCVFGLLSGLHPRTAYRIQLQEMENDGGLLACCVNATILALINSGIEMKFLLAAVYCAIDEDGNIFLDAPTKEVKTKGSKVKSATFVFDGVEKSVVAVHTEGSLTLEQYKLAQDLCQAASEDVFGVYRKIAGNFAKIV